MRISWLLLLGALLAAFVAYKLAYPTYTWRQKLTVEVQVGDEVHAASSVSERSITYQPSLLPDIPGVRSDLTGEAVTLDVGGRGHLFALLSGGNNNKTSLYDLARLVFQDVLPSSSRELFSTLSRLRQARSVPRKYYPMLVTFTDIADPTTVKRVDPNDLAASFGPGVTLRRITLEITDEPVTKRVVDHVLGWLDTIKGRLKPTEKRYADELTIEETLYSTDFKKG